MEHSNKDFREALSDLIRERKIKLRSLGAKTSLDFSYFSKLTRRKGAPPIETMINISNALDVTPEYFLEYRIHKIDEVLKNNPEIIEEVLTFAYDLERKQKLKIADKKAKFDK